MHIYIHIYMYMYIDDVWPWYVVPMPKQTVLTNLTALVNSWRILPLDSTLSVQRSISSWLGISISNLTWFSSDDNTNFVGKERKSHRTGKTDHRFDATLVESHWHIRRVDSLILAERRPGGNIKLFFTIYVHIYIYIFIIYDVLVAFLLIIKPIYVNRAERPFG